MFHVKIILDLNRGCRCCRWNPRDPGRVRNTSVASVGAVVHVGGVRCCLEGVRMTCEGQNTFGCEVQMTRAVIWVGHAFCGIPIINRESGLVPFK